MSSRNVHLGPEDRTAATVIRRAALAVRDAFEAGGRDASALCHRAATIIADEGRARIDYVELVDQVELRALTTIDRPAVLLVAAWFGDVRLIDNELLETP
jgi:pantoate--beta-alanine ligase